MNNEHNVEIVDREEDHSSQSTQVTTTNSGDEEQSSSFFHHLPVEYRDPRFTAAYASLARHTDCREETLFRALDRAEQHGGTMSISFVYFMCSMISTLNDHGKVTELRERAAAAFRHDPTEFTESIKIRIALYSAFKEGALVEEQVPLLYYDENRPESAKLEYLILIACLLVLEPVVSLVSLGVNPERLANIIKYCIQINVEKLEAEYAEVLKNRIVGY